MQKGWVKWIFECCGNQAPKCMQNSCAFPSDHSNNCILKILIRLSNHSNHLTIPTIRLSDCLTILISLSNSFYLNYPIRHFRQINSPTILIIWQFWQFQHSNCQTIQLSNFPTVQQSNDPTMLRIWQSENQRIQPFQPFWSAYYGCWLGSGLIVRIACLI